MKRFWTALLAIATVLALCAPLALASAGGTLLKEGAKGDEVTKIQNRLIELGFLEGEADGYFGAKTKQAVIAFQRNLRDHGLEDAAVDGIVGDQVRAHLFDENYDPEKVVLKQGSKGDEVLRAQQRLIELGFLTGKADGDYGKKTKEAVLAFQKHLNAQGRAVREDGAVGDELRAYLFDESYNPYLTDVKLGDEGDAVVRVQRRLLTLNYTDQAADGNFGDNTRLALAAFQKAHNLPESGVADKATTDALFSAAAWRAERPVRRTLSEGDEGETVVEMQARLIEWGFLGGVPDGVYGSGTTQALGRLRDHLEAVYEEGAAPAWAQPLWESVSTVSPEMQTELLERQIPLFKKEVKSGGKGAEVSRVQRRLNALLYLRRGLIDGAYGKNTTAAVKSFQEVNGLEPTGVADEETQNLLFSAQAKHKDIPYLLKVVIDEQKTYAYQLDENGEYQLVREMICTTGLPATPTPTGIFLEKTGPQERWHYFTQYVCWAQYTYGIEGNILFHSVLYYDRSESSLNHTSVANLGRKASHGCVRLSVPDAKWVYETCPKGTAVVVV